MNAAKRLTVLAACVLCVGARPASLAATSEAGFIRAVKNQDFETARNLMKQGVDVNVRQPDGATALHWAAQWDDAKTVDLLIRSGAFVDVTNDYGTTPLSLACTNGSAPVVQLLLDAGADPNAALPTGETPLMTAARTGTVGAVGALLAHGANVRAVESSAGQTALMWAVAEGHLEAVQLLIAHGADVNARSRKGYTPLLFSARIGHEATTDLLLNAGAEVDEAAPDGTTALLMAVIRGHHAYAELLLKHGADPNVGGFTPLQRAVGNWDSTLTTSIADDSEWRMLGGLRGDIKLDFVRLLLQHDADPHAPVQVNPGRYGGGGRANLIGATPFFLAAQAGDTELMRLLLSYEVDPHVAAADGTTPLIAAAGLGRRRVNPEAVELEAVKLCLDLGIDVNAANQDGETALHAAAYQGADGLVEILAERGADLDVKNRLDWTPLAIAEGVYVGANIQRFPTTVSLLEALGAAPSDPGVNRSQWSAARAPK